MIKTISEIKNHQVLMTVLEWNLHFNQFANSFFQKQLFIRMKANVRPRVLPKGTTAPQSPTCSETECWLLCQLCEQSCIKYRCPHLCLTSLLHCSKAECCVNRAKLSSLCCSVLFHKRLHLWGRTDQTDGRARGSVSARCWNNKTAL